ncbi:MmyB family transcriptional regulator [Nonomuraea candida]|uniref:MmyB family transcriptional regulator n=1 Tax=Nonomuraea candida TaxID=359159 RepID=UPI0012FC489A|nr:hypothetical protein [Nonomuraea candida]
MMLDMPGQAPALLMTGVLDILALNRMGAALLADFGSCPAPSATSERHGLGQ